MEFKKKIHSSEIDCHGKLYLPRVLEIVQDAVTETLGDMGFDNILLREKFHSMWVYTHNYIKAKRMPLWNEEIKVTCECLKSDKLRNYMVTKFYDLNGEEIISSVIEFVLIDIESFRLLRLSTIGYPIHEKDAEVDFKFEETNYSEELPFTVTSMMIDYSRHMNNIQSIVHFLDTFSLDELDQVYCDSYDFIVKYAAQGLYGDKLVLKKGRTGETFGFRIDDLNGKNILIAQLRNHR